MRREKRYVSIFHEYSERKKKKGKRICFYPELSCTLHYRDIFSYSHIQINVLPFNMRFLEYDLNLIITKNFAIAIISNIKYLFEYYKQFT